MYLARYYFNWIDLFSNAQISNNNYHLIIIELIESDLKSNTFFLFALLLLCLFQWLFKSIYRFDWMVPWTHWPRYICLSLYRSALGRKMIDIFDKIRRHINSIDYRTEPWIVSENQRKKKKQFDFGLFTELTGYHYTHSAHIVPPYIHLILISPLCYTFVQTSIQTSVLFGKMNKYIENNENSSTKSHRVIKGIKNLRFHLPNKANHLTNNIKLWH